VVSIVGVVIVWDARLIPILIVGLAAAIIVGEVVALRTRRRQERMRVRLGHLVTDTVLTEPIIKPARRPALRQTSERIGRRASRLLPQRFVTSYRGLLARAGSAEPAALPVLIATKLATAIGGVLLGPALYGSLLTFTPAGGAISAVVGLLLGYLFPDLWLQRRIRAYARALRIAIPSGIDLLTISLEAGLGFEGALSHVCSSTDDAFSREMSAYLRLRSVGHGRKDALDGVAARTEVAEMRTFTSSVAQAEELGVGLAAMLRDLASDLRLRYRQAVAARAQTASLRMMIPIVIFILPAIFIVVLGPAISAVSHSLG